MRESCKDAKTQSGPPQATVRSGNEAAKRRRRGGRRSGGFAACGLARTRGRYARAAVFEGDVEPFEEKMGRWVGALPEQQAEGRRLDGVIWKALGGLGL